MPPPPQTTAFRQSLAPTSAYTRHLALTSAQATIYHDLPAAPPPQLTERDILLAHHRFLPPSPSPTSPSALTPTPTYEQTLAATYSKKLYKEFVLISLTRWRDGLVAMRWRTEDEVRSLKGEDICGELSCSNEATREQEVLFEYFEFGEEKEAMVKVRLCGGCAEKLGRAREREGKGKKKEDDGGRGRRRRREWSHRDGERSRGRSGGDGERRRDEGRRSGDGERQKHRRRRTRSRSPAGSDGRRGSRRRRSRSRHRHRSE